MQTFCTDLFQHIILTLKVLSILFMMFLNMYISKLDLAIEILDNSFILNNLEEIIFSGIHKSNL